VFGWFASWHTLLPLAFSSMQGKPSVLVVGGYDLAKLPSIGYGHQRGGVRKSISRLCLRLATFLVTNSYFSKAEAMRNAGLPPERVCMIYHGVPDLFGTLPERARGGTALSVGLVTRENMRRKGHAAFVSAAALLPRLEFVLVGRWRDDAIAHLRKLATPNVTFSGWLEETALRDQYRHASIYVQVSAHEGFGMSVAEAMLAGCIPVATPVGSLPEVVGDAGIFAQSQEPNEVAWAIRRACHAPDRQRRRAREYILSNFPVQTRQRKLCELVSAASELAVP
jgi:glycosyltransferase involved in cell wall biosynthesis